jgi:hypothetical protein
MSTPNGRTDSLQFCCKRTSTHHKCYGLRTVHVHAPCARVRARMCTFAYFLTDYVQIYYDSHTTTHHKWQGLCTFPVTHRVYACKRASASVCVITHSLIYGRIFFKFAVNILQVTSSSMGNVLFMFTHRAHTCERACATERVVKHSLIYGPMLFKFAVNILQITTSSMGYVLFMITQRARAYERLVKTFTHLWTDSLQICWAHTTDDHHGLHTRSNARASASVINCSLIYGRFTSDLG